MSKLSNVADNDIVKETVNDELVKTVNAVDAIDIFLLILAHMFDSLILDNSKKINSRILTRISPEKFK